MGVGYSVSRNRVVASSMVDILNTTTTDCVAFTQNTLEGLNIVISSSTVGNISFVQQATATADCLITNNISSIAENYLTNLQESGADAGRGRGLSNIGGIQVALSTATTQIELETAITNAIVNNCSATAENTIQNINITISNSGVGDIELIQQGDAKTTCVATNLALVQAYIDLQNQSTSNAGGEGGGGLITLIVVTIIIVVIIGAITALLSSIGGGGRDCTPYPCDALEGGDYTACKERLPYDPTVHCPSAKSFYVEPVPENLIYGQYVNGQFVEGSVVGGEFIPATV